MTSENVTERMADTSIRVTDKLADELFDRKQRGESYEDVIWRLIHTADAAPSETPATHVEIDTKQLEGALSDILIAVDNKDREAAEDAASRIREAIDDE